MLTVATVGAGAGVAAAATPPVTTTTDGAPPTSAPGKPVVSTAAARQITVNGATVGGSINAEGQATTYWIEFGPTSGYGYQTEVASGGDGVSAQSVTAALTGLPARKTIHYRVVAENAYGTSYGADASFTTDAPAPVVSRVAVLGHIAFGSTTEASVMAACLHGQTRCSAAMTITHDGVTIGGTRRSFALAPGAGGVIQLVFNASGRKLMMSDPSGFAAKVYILNGGKILARKGVHLEPFRLPSGTSRTRPQRPLN